MKKPVTGNLFLAAFYVVSFLGVAYSAQVCKARLDCPGNYNNDTVKVANNVVALSEQFFHCAPDSVNEGFNIGKTDTISVFFVIDHSGSMSYMDSTGIRYRLVRNLIDSLYAKSPASEVGIAVFSNQLLHSYEDDPYFVQLDSRWHDSYVPLTRLDGTVDGVSAVEKLKWAIDIASNPNDTDLGGNLRLLNGNYSPTGRFDSRVTDIDWNKGYNGTTDVTLAFDAAREAFISASYPKENQYIIFLSDGISQNVDRERADFEFDYMDKVDNLPTTFTAFFVNVNKPIPWQIDSMTNHIAVNGYSTTNTKSSVWVTRGSESELSTKLIGQLSLGNGMEHFTSTPVSLTINGETTTNFDETFAYLTKEIPLTGQSTTLDISYTWHWDSPLNREETKTFTTIVTQSSSPDELETDCWDQGTLKFYYQGTEITSGIEEQQRILEVRFYPPAELGLTSADIVVKNAEGTDSLILTTSSQGQYFSASFTREYASPKIDNLLQNAFYDSVVAIYRNPALPLDTLRIAAAVDVPRDIAVANAFYVDQDANGYPDIIRVIQGSEKLSSAEVAAIAPYIVIQSDRDISIESVRVSDQGFDILLTEPASSATPFTGLLPDERLLIDRVSNLPGGGEFPISDVLIADSMAPVIISAVYYDNVVNTVRDTLEVVFSENIKTIVNQQPFILQNDTTDYNLRLSEVSTDSNKAVFSVFPAVGLPNPQKGDLINISISGGVSDSAGNTQDYADNVQRTLEYYLLYNIKTAAYFDTTGDGLIDLVRVTTDEPPDAQLLESLYSTLTLPSYRQFLPYDKADFSVTDDGFVIRVAQPSGLEPNTAVDSRDVLTVSYTEAQNGSVIKPTTIPIADSLAPVLISVTYTPGNSGGTAVDTVTAKFSEPVPAPSGSEPFLFYDPKTKTTYSMQLHYVKQKSPSEHVFSVVTKEKQFPEWQDSVSINPVSGVKDIKGNIQDSENRQSPLLFEEQTPEFKVTSLPNPFDPTTSTIPVKVRNYYGISTEKGLIIVAEPLSQSAGFLKLSGRITIYDAVGNIVISNAEGHVEQATKGIAYVWDGKNSKGQYVGAGTYLAVVVIENDGKPIKTKRYKLGVKRTVVVVKE